MEEKKPVKKEQEIIYYQEDEIDLYELWLTLKKRWKIVVGTAFLFIFIGTAYIFVSTPLYQVKVYLKNMYIGGQPVENTGKVANFIESKLETKDKQFVEKKAHLQSVKVKKIDKEEFSDIIVLTIIGLSNKNAFQYAKDIITSLQKNYSPFMDKYIKQTNNKIEQLRDRAYLLENYRIKELERKKSFLLNEEIKYLKQKRKFYQNKVKKLEELIKNYTDSMSNYETAIKNLSKSMNNPNLSDSSLLILSNQIAQYENLITSLKNKIKNYEIQINDILKNTIPEINKKIKHINEFEINNINEKIKKFHIELKKIQREMEILELSLKPPLTENFKIIGESFTNHPYKPKKKLILAVSAVSGLFLGVFLAFFLEWIENASRRHKNNQTQ